MYKAIEKRGPHFGIDAQLLKYRMLHFLCTNLQVGIMTDVVTLNLMVISAGRKTSSSCEQFSGEATEGWIKWNNCLSN